MAKDKAQARQKRGHGGGKNSSSATAQGVCSNNTPLALIASPIPRLERERCPLLSKADYEGMVARCQQLERRVFPKAEAMDLSCELRKPNQYLFVVVKRDSARDPPSTDLMAYGVLALTKIDSTARISKVCTDPAFRRRGAGRLLVRSMLAALGHKDAQVAVPAAVACVPVENSSYNCGITELPPSQYIQLQRGGSSLMEISSIQLHVDKARDEAIRLYTRCGFHVKAEIANYYAEGRDALLMAIHFSQQDTAAA